MKINKSIFLPVIIIILLFPVLCGSCVYRSVMPENTQLLGTAEMTVPVTSVPTPEGSTPATTTPVASPTAEPTPEPTPEPPSYTGPDLEEKEPAEDAFFENAAFFGNSLVDGLRLYGSIKNASFYGENSATVISVTNHLTQMLDNGSYVSLLDKMLQEEHDKVYILLGINEIGFETKFFIETYSRIMDRIWEKYPETDIYIMSLTPVSKLTSDTHYLFNKEHISAYNEALYALAEERECYYIDLVDALGDENGYLPAQAAAGDGVHFQPFLYTDWTNYIYTHYAETDKS